MMRNSAKTTPQQEKLSREEMKDQPVTTSGFAIGHVHLNRNNARNLMSRV
jgi:hypothetical protein